jgi:tRNA A37 methylthiotransferase MiaB
MCTAIQSPLLLVVGSIAKGEHMESPVVSTQRKPVQFPIAVKSFVAAPAESKGSDFPSTQRLEGKRLFVAGQLSCASSRVSFGKYEEYILRHGAGRAESAREADIILFDSCAFDATQEKKSLELIEDNEKFAKPDAKLIVTGCLAGISPDKLQSKYRCEFFAPKDEKQLAYFLGLDPDEDQFLAFSDPRGHYMGASTFAAGDWKVQTMARAASVLHRLDRVVPLSGLPFLKHVLAASQAANSHAYAMSISRGCLGNCSFCVIPMAKGKTTSLPLGMIVDRIQDAVVQGTERIILASEDIGAYGKDMDVEFPDLLEKILQIKGEFSLYLHFYDPRWLRTQGDRLIPMLQSGRIKYLQSPLQSGSDRILKLMRRGYLIGHVLPVIERIRREAPRVSFGTQMIAGFPSETPSEHDETRQILKMGLIDYVDIFPFSSRTGAAAEELPDHLPRAVVEERARDLHKAWRRSRYLLP